VRHDGNTRGVARKKRTEGKGNTMQHNIRITRRSGAEAQVNLSKPRRWFADEGEAGTSSAGTQNTGHMIPKARLDEVLEQKRQLEQTLAKFQEWLQCYNMNNKILWHILNNSDYQMVNLNLILHPMAYFIKQIKLEQAYIILHKQKLVKMR
jgi:hypothetical protein